MPDLERARISNIAIYPVKSCGRVELQRAQITPGGLRTLSGIPDHGWMIVQGTPNEEGVHEFITQRDHKTQAKRVDGRVIPAVGFNDMTLIKPNLTDSGELVLTWNGAQPIDVPRESDPSRVLTVRVWKHTGPAVEVPQLSEWASDQLKHDVRLVSATGPWDRMTSQEYLANNNPLGFHDGYPAHYYDLSDLSELSEKAQANVPWTRFRPQIVVTGMPAQAVHQVFEGTIAGITFVDPKPCDRCQIPSIDQDTGEVTNIKPLSILKTYKKWVKPNGEIGYVFGENMLPQGSGEIAVGDELVVTSHRNPPLVYG